MNVLKSEASEERGEFSHQSTFIGAIAIADMLKTTLGPLGMDKILQSMSGVDSLTITNDGATILSSLSVDNPAARVLINLSTTQDQEIGDGTTSVVVFAGELLRMAEQLIARGIPVPVIREGYQRASAAALAALTESANANDGSEEAFREELFRIAMTTLSSKILNVDKKFFANMAVDAVLRLGGSTNLANIQIIKKLGKTMEDSFLDEGFILDKQISVGCPVDLKAEDPEHPLRVLVANTSMDADKVKIFGSKAKVSGATELAAIESEERRRMRDKCARIMKHDINCFVNRQLVYNQAEEEFAAKGVMCIEHADFDGIERLSLVLDADILSTFDTPEKARVGTCQRIHEIMIGEDKLIRFAGVPKNQACTIVLRGASKHLLDEAERSLHDALAVLSQTVKDRHTCLGAGSSEMLMSLAVSREADEREDLTQVAMGSFSQALENICFILCENAGLDANTIVAKLHAAHAGGHKTAGIDIVNGCVGDARELGIVEALKSKRQMVMSATEAASQLLKVDNIIRCAPRERQQGQ
ncbi:Chaperonin Cpn60/TCP-1 [Carpediemonas membranifera]|uniref:CCT-beta n=1 Tax=Carpediemonas membranifera TaxID=201153 RepID=A0A8J6E364_9EUKA|nr:Chaperonin Cpn60/TCP-1 [Carpediemonas membranifera]|eukprot:KAG9395528.1 Chaperonin Cpn60/TCP-1 [Carpediemonas membranifera]